MRPSHSIAGKRGKGENWLHFVIRVGFGSSLDLRLPALLASLPRRPCLSGTTGPLLRRDELYAGSLNSCLNFPQRLG